MKKRHFVKSTAFALILFCFSVGSIYAQPRFFDNAQVSSDNIRLTIFHPTIGSIKAIQNLREKDLFDINNLKVIGVYHKNERNNYERSIKYVEKNQIDWMDFHQISGQLNELVLFSNNSCTDEFKTIFNKSDGIIFFGGADIPPSIYNEKTNLLTNIYTPYRHFLELSCVFHLLGGSQDEAYKPLLESNPAFPILGICLGEQTLNVGTGGTMVQDIWSEQYGLKYVEDVIRLKSSNWHYNPFDKLYPDKELIHYNMHKIQLLEKGKLISEFGFEQKDQPFVVSSHHQMVDQLGKGMRIIATSLDGQVPEAIEHVDYPNVLGVQFHPEFTVLWNPEKTFQFRPQDRTEKSLFSIIEENPPSLKFHKKIWSWFEEKLRAYHQSK